MSNELLNDYISKCTDVNKERKNDILHNDMYDKELKKMKKEENHEEVAGDDLNADESMNMSHDGCDSDVNMRSADPSDDQLEESVKEYLFTTSVKSDDSNMSNINLGTPSNKTTSSSNQMYVVKKEKHTCSTCGKFFTRVFNLNRHIKTVHVGESTFVCGICNKPCKTSFEMKRHLRRHDTTYPHEVKVEVVKPVTKPVLYKHQNSKLGPTNMVGKSDETDVETKTTTIVGKSVETNMQTKKMVSILPKPCNNAVKKQGTLSNLGTANVNLVNFVNECNSVQTMDKPFGTGMKKQDVQSKINKPVNNVNTTGKLMSVLNKLYDKHNFSSELKTLGDINCHLKESVNGSVGPFNNVKTVEDCINDVYDSGLHIAEPVNESDDPVCDSGINVNDQTVPPSGEHGHDGLSMKGDNSAGSSNEKAYVVSKAKHTCRVCGIYFTQSSNLNRHLKNIHSGEQSLICAACNKLYFTPAELKNHMKTHDTESSNDVHAHYRSSDKGWVNNEIKTHNVSSNLNENDANIVKVKIEPGETYMNIGKLKNEPVHFANDVKTKEVKTAFDKPDDNDLCVQNFSNKTGNVDQIQTEDLMDISKNPYDCDTSDGECDSDNSFDDDESVDTLHPSDIKIINQTPLISYDKKKQVLDYLLPTCAVEASSTKDQMFVISKEKHPCKACGRHFTRASNLKRHIKTLHLGERSQICGICDKLCATPMDMKMHMQTHDPETLHKCHVCEKEFNKMKSLELHMAEHTYEGSHYCEICYLQFSTLTGLNIHRLTHKGKNGYKCEECDREFGHFNDYKSHKLMHDEIDLHMCYECTKVFQTPEELSGHHCEPVLATKPHTCEVCGRHYSTASNLNKHKKNHSGHRPYACGVCSMGFMQSSDLKTHMFIHTGEKPHRCDVCGIAFTTKRSLNRHGKVHFGSYMDAVQQEITDAVQQKVTEVLQQEITDDVQQQVTDGVQQEITDAVQQQVTDGVQQGITEAVQQQVMDAVQQQVTNAVQQVTHAMHQVTDTVQQEVSDTAHEQD